VFPGPGFLALIAVEAFERSDRQPRFAVGAQAQVDFVEDAGGGARGEPGVEALGGAGVGFECVGVGVVEEVDEVEIGDVAQFLAAELAIGDHGEARVSVWRRRSLRQT